jgi:hypothetical protein
VQGDVTITCLTINVLGMEDEVRKYFRQEQGRFLIVFDFTL